MWGVYSEAIGIILKLDEYNQDEKIIREYIYKEGLFGWFNPLIHDL